MQFLRKIA